MALGASGPNLYAGAMFTARHHHRIPIPSVLLSADVRSFEEFTGPSGMQADSCGFDSRGALNHSDRDCDWGVACVCNSVEMETN
jgi:hypothetical protein